MSSFCEIGLHHGRSNSALGLETMHFFGGNGGRTDRAICPCDPCDPSIIKIIPATYFSIPPYVDMADVKGVKGKPEGLVKKHAHTPGSLLPPFYSGGTLAHLALGVRDVTPCSSDWRKEGCLPKVQIGDCDQELDATCQGWRETRPPGIFH